MKCLFFFFSSRRRHTRLQGDWSSDVCSSDLLAAENPPKILRHKSSRQTEAEKRRMTELEKRRNLRATELELDPTLIASRAMLVMLARDWTAHEKGLMGWQKQLLSER